MSTHAMQQPHDMAMIDKESSNMGMAFILGAAIGAISGLLIAPKSGREMRDTIKTRTDDMNAMAHDKINLIKDKAYKVTDRMKHKADQATDTADQTAAHSKSTIEKIDLRASSRQDI